MTRNRATSRADVIGSAVEDALVRWAHEQLKLISIRVSGTAVTLAGSVPSHAADRAIMAAVRNVPGVAEISDELRIVPYLAPTPSESDRQ